MIDLYTVPTANGQKIHIMLEETGLAYRPHLVDLYKGEHRAPEFRKLNPFARVPVIVDHDAPGEGDFAVCETGAILRYLAAKSGQFLPADIRLASEVDQWLSFISANVGPLFRGGFMFSTMVPNPAAAEYFVAEAQKAFGVLNDVLATRSFLVGETYTIADISAYPVAATSGKQLPQGLTPYPHVRRWAEAIAARAAVQRGMALFTK
ncbi:MAG: glutathione S-transferase family protein [Rhodospirillaceae bacterium]|nr:glutathione S-transferase family protein [Rhodospirillaceae bacterium]